MGHASSVVGNLIDKYHREVNVGSGKPLSESILTLFSFLLFQKTILGNTFLKSSTESTPEVYLL